MSLLVLTFEGILRFVDYFPESVSDYIERNLEIIPNFFFQKPDVEGEAIVLVTDREKKNKQQQQHRTT